MRGKPLLDALLELCKAKGLAVRREALKAGISQGGLCMLKGVATLFVDDRAQIDAQIELIAGVLRRFEWSDDERAAMVPAVLTVIVRQRAGRSK
ncbi:MAG: hypothetical protein Q8Q09_20660 [Deltaproteobacteria bacterium]|nr:hypothetical protein [Deltaproteobacteria bacterium]